MLEKVELCWSQHRFWEGYQVQYTMQSAFLNKHTSSKNCLPQKHVKLNKEGPHKFVIGETQDIISIHTHIQCGQKAGTFPGTIPLSC